MFRKNDMPARPRCACVLVAAGSSSRMGGDKLAMKLFFKMQEKNAAADPRAAEMLEGMRGGFDGTDRAAIAPVAARVRALDAAAVSAGSAERA